MNTCKIPPGWYSYGRKENSGIHQYLKYTQIAITLSWMALHLCIPSASKAISEKPLNPLVLAEGPVWNFM